MGNILRKVSLSETGPKSRLTDRVQLEIEAEQLAESLPPLRAGMVRPRDNVTQGVHGYRRVGTGESFWQFRRFQEGDFCSDIDWRASARHEHLHVREREKESPVRFRIWWNDATSMHYRSNPGFALKSGRAAVLMLALARLLRHGGENVELLQNINTMSSASTSGISYYILASDFLDTQEVIPQCLAYKHPGLLMHVLDPAEEDFPFQGRTGFTTAEGIVHQLLGSAEKCAHEYRRRFAEHSDSIRLGARKCGWSFLRHRTDVHPQEALLELHRHLSALDTVEVFA